MLCEILDHSHQRICIGKEFILKAQWMDRLNPFCRLRPDKASNNRLRKGAVQRQISFGYTCGCLKSPLITQIVAAERPDVLECARLTAHDPFTGNEISIDRVCLLFDENRLVEARRQRVDEINVA